MEKYILLDKLKETSHSTIHKGINKEDNKIYALKVIHLIKLSVIEKEQLFQSINLLSTIKHEYIISFKEIFYYNDQNIVLVMEFADKGDLLQIINKYKNSKNRKNYFKESKIRIILIQIVKGLKYLHKNNIIHCNLTSSNILLFKDGKAKIGNLNMAIKSENQPEFNYFFSPWSYKYESPEKQKKQGISIKTDIWSLGCILYEMTTLNLPFKDRNLTDISVQIMNYRMNKSYQYSDNLYNLISSLIQIAPYKRPTCEKILSHPFIKTINNIQLVRIEKKVDNFIQEEELKQNENSYLEMNMATISTGKEYFVLENLKGTKRLMAIVEIMKVSI